jgi:tape measure domain-containing protein
MTVDIETIGIGADTSGVVKGTKDLDNFDRQANKSSKSADGLTDSIGGMVKSFIGISAAYAGFQKLANVLDEYTKYTVILKNATAGQNEFNAAMADIRRIANTAQTDVAGLATTYARFSNALKEFGATQSQVSTLTETVALALKANGASAMETSSAMLQLSQAFGAGRLSGDEFRSMAEAAPNLMRALAASIGVSVGALKEMGAEGKLTSDVLLKAFTDPALLQALRGQAKEVNTISGSWQKLKNEIEASFTAFESATGFVGSLAISIAQLADGIKIIRGFFSRDTVGDLNNELSTAMDKLAAYRRGNAFDRQVLGGREYETELRTKIAVLSRQLKDATTVKVDPRTLQTNAQIDSGWMSDEQKAYEKLLKKRQEDAKKLADEQAEYARKVAELQSDIQVEFYQDERKRMEKAAKDERELAMQESAWKAKQEDDYQKKLLKDWQAREKEKADIIKKNDDDAEKAALKQAQDLQKEYDRISDNLSRSLTDAIYRGFEKGKSFIDNFIDTLKNAFKTTILQPTIQMIIDKTGITALMATISSAITGTANAASLYDPTASGGSILSRGVDIVKGITQGFEGLNNTFSNSIADLGALIANGNGGIRDAIGGALGQYSQGISQALGIAGAAYAGFNFIKQGNYAGAALTAGGYALGGPVGGAIGAAIGSLFGGNVSTKKYSTGVTGLYSNGQFTSSNQSGLAGYGRALGGNEGLASVLKAYSEVVSGLFKAFDMGADVNTAASLFQRSSKKTRAWGYFSANAGGGSVGFSSAQPFGSAQAAMEDLVNRIMTEGITTLVRSSNLPEGVRMLFEGLTSKETVQSMIVASINLGNAQDALASRFGLTADTAGKVAVATGYADDQLAAFVNTLASTALATQKTSVSLLKQRDSLTESIGSLPSSIAAFDALLKAIDTSTAGGQSQFADLFGLREQFANFTNAWDSVVGNVESAIYGLLSPSEQLAMDQANLAKMFAELNLSVPSSLQDLISLGKSIDFTTEAGLDLALAFPTLVEAFKDTKEGVESLSQSLSSNYFTTRADFLSAQISASNGGGAQQFVKSQAQINADLVAQLKQMKQTNMDLKAYLTTLSENAAKQQRTLESWDVEGMPAVRTE